MNNSLRIPREYSFTKYGKEYYMLLKHKKALWYKYRIDFTINNQAYNIKHYNKS